MSNATRIAVAALSSSALTLIVVGAFMLFLPRSKSIERPQRKTPRASTEAKPAPVVTEVAEAHRAVVVETPQKKPQSCDVSGELFTRNVSGEILRGAGISIWAIPIDDDFRAHVAKLMSQWRDDDKESGEFFKMLDNKFPGHLVEFDPEHPDRYAATKKDREAYDAAYRKHSDEHLQKIEAFEKAAENCFRKKIFRGTTNSMGEFTCELGFGNYVLLSGHLSIQRSDVVWCKSINVDDAKLSLSLGPRETVTDTPLFQGTDAWVSSRQLLRFIAAEPQ